MTKDLAAVRSSFAKQVILESSFHSLDRFRIDAGSDDVLERSVVEAQDLPIMSVREKGSVDSKRRT